MYGLIVCDAIVPVSYTHLDVYKRQELKENNRIYREMESIYHEICVKAGISDTDFIVLYSIVEFEDGCCQRKIAKQYSISRQIVNSSVKKLVQNGCVVLESGKGHDKQIVLTEKGKAMAKQKIIPVMEACLLYTSRCV